MKVTISPVFAALLLAIFPVTVAASSHSHDAVRTHNGEVIKNTFDNCVVTKWQSGEYDCEKETPKINTELLNIYFNFDSAELTPVAQDKLEKVIEMLETAEQVESIDIVGYTDYLGNPSYNRALSQRRANAVRSYLESRGYLNTRNVAVMALGENHPVTDCSTLSSYELKACLWRDRRVEIKLNYSE